MDANIYGILYLLGAFAAFAAVFLLARSAHLDWKLYLEVIFIVTIIGLLGSRLLGWYVLAGIGRLSFMDMISNTGTFYGGFLAGLLATMWQAKLHKISFLALSDVFMPPLALSQVFGRVGCFLAGCCYGTPTYMPWGIHNKYLPPTVLIHPVQLYEAACSILLFAFLLFIWPRRKHEGQITSLYLIIYPLIRYIFENFRGDERGVQILGHSIGQFISIILFMTGIILQMIIIIKARKISPQES